MEEKVIRDSVMGYIYIPTPFLNEIVDTPEFQRLRRIEQTSMRCLFPSARHDRFIHSLGVYHLSRSVSSAIKQLSATNATNYENLLMCFEVAALLHDVGHSPFSHTLEENFDKNKLITDISEHTVAKTWSDEFIRDLKISGAAEHELMSVFVILKNFYDRICLLFNKMSMKESPDFEFIARAIIGAQYGTNEKVTENGLIRLLNSKAIDIDKLDFITRDSLMAGYDNTNIDIQRLLRSLVIKKVGHDGYITFTKSAMSVIENVVIARNALYSWIYGHPRVIYESKLIQDAVRVILNRSEEDEDAKQLRELFTADGIIKKLSCDDDVWCILKRRASDIKQCQELLNRGIQWTPIWKSPTEYRILFSNPEMQKIGDFDVTRFNAVIAGDNKEEQTKALEYIVKFFNDDSIATSDFMIIKSTIKMATLDGENIYISIGSDVYPFSKLNPIVSVSNVTVPYMYCSREIKEKIKKAGGVKLFCEYIKTFLGFALKDNS
jgi:HD superfamily phosphohydrolase